jgi:hypothetical protein
MLGGMDDEALLRGRVYGADHGGPLDGLLLDVTGWDADQLADGAALPTEIGKYGAGGRAHYEPRPADPRRWDWAGDTP